MDEKQFINTANLVLKRFIDNTSNDEQEKMFIRSAVTTNLQTVLATSSLVQDKIECAKLQALERKKRVLKQKIASSQEELLNLETLTPKKKPKLEVKQPKQDLQSDDDVFCSPELNQLLKENTQDVKVEIEQGVTKVEVDENVKDEDQI